MANHTTPSFKKLSDILSSSDTLSGIYDHIIKIKALQVKLHEELESPLNEHVTVADYRNKTLVLHTDNAAWAAKLRFKTSAILAILKNDLTDIQSVRTKVVPVSPTVSAPPPARKISPETARLLRQLADNTADDALRSVLYNISKNTS